MTALTAGKYWRMRRLADAKGRFKMMAIDQRKVLADPLAERLGIASPTHAQVALFKRLVVETLAPHVSAVLLDPYYAYPGAIEVLPANSGLLTTIEEAPAEKRRGRQPVAHLYPAWPVAKGMRAGSDAIKLLVFYRPDAPAATFGISRRLSATSAPNAASMTWCSCWKSWTTPCPTTKRPRRQPMPAIANASSRASRPLPPPSSVSTSSSCLRRSARAPAGRHRRHQGDRAGLRARGGGLRTTLGAAVGRRRRCGILRPADLCLPGEGERIPGRASPVATRDQVLSR